MSSNVSSTTESGYYDSASSFSEHSSSSTVRNHERRHGRIDTRTLDLLDKRHGRMGDFSKVVTTYAQIARESRLAASTVSSAIRAFHKGSNPARGWDSDLEWDLCKFRIRVPANVEVELTSLPALRAMGSLSLSRRVKLINEKHALTLSAATLRLIYHRNGVRFQRAKRLYPWNRPELV